MLDSTSARSTPLTSAHRQPHAVVIGSGFGGLAAAIRLGARGYRVTVLEKLDAPGGRAYVYRQDGFTFDAGPTIVTAPFLFEELWELCGRKHVRRRDAACRCRRSIGSAFRTARTSTTPATPARCAREIARFSPGDVDGYDAFMKASEEIFKVGFERARRRAVQLLDRHGADRCPSCSGCRAIARVYSLVVKLLPRPAAAGRVQLPSAADRRQSVHGDVDLLPDRVSGAALGRAFCHGRHRAAGATAWSG